jgi:tetratricopeptide (TPR) repeat protein
MKPIAKENSTQARVVATLPRVEARFIIETRQWRSRPVTDKSTAPELLATGLSAANLGDTSLAEEASLALAKLTEAAATKESFYNRQLAPLQIMHKQVEGSRLIAAGQLEAGLARLEESVQIANQMPLPRGAANPIKPAHELYGEALLAASRPADAVEQFRVGLLRMPNRPLGLLGSARAYAALGDVESARDNYRQLAVVWRNRDFPELREAELNLAGVQ